MRCIFYLMIIFLSFIINGCAKPPKLPEMKPTTGIQTTSSSALSDLNLILEVYLPPNYKDTFYYIKPIGDSTGLSSTGEIPLDITPLVRESFSQVFYKVRTVEQYDQSDATHLQVENFLITSQKLRGVSSLSLRPNADFRVEGSISQFDRSLSSTADSSSIDGSFGGGQGYTSVNLGISDTSRVSRIAVSFSVYNKQGISIPGKYSSSMDVYFSKSGKEIGFSIGGHTIGFGTQSTSMHGRHMALQMLSEVAVTQIIGRTLGIPYWRTLPSLNIFKQDNIVLNDWRKQYQSLIMDSLLIPFIQSQCIANGDFSVAVTGVLDESTRAALDRFADKFGVSNRNYPNYQIYEALELNRLLDRNTAARAWNAYNAYKAGVRPTAPAAAPAATPQPKPAAAPAAPARKEPAASGRPAPRPRSVPEVDVTAPLEDLI